MTRVRRPILERQVLVALERRLMRPELVAAFCAAFIAEWNRMAAEISAGAATRKRELQALEQKIANLIGAIEDGLRDPGVRQRLDDLRARQRLLLEEQRSTTTPAPPALHPNIGQAYAARVANLREALDADDAEEVLEAARALIDRVVVSSPEGPDDPPGIELEGSLMAMLAAGGADVSSDSVAFTACVDRMLGRSTKGDLRGRFSSPALSPRPPMRRFADDRSALVRAPGS